MNKFSKLVDKLKELFQLDQPDLDFGFYRIMHQKSAEVNEYLNVILPKTVSEAFAEGEAQTNTVQQNFEEAKKSCLNALGETAIDAQGNVLEMFQATPFAQNYIQAKKALEESGGSSSSDQESEVYSHLLRFFSRYYDKGDFISKRRYKGDTYAIPYSGEEVMLHWANKDQYYIKSGESFSNYSIKLEDGRRAHFKLISADTAKDNQKQSEKERCFVLVEEKTVQRLDEEGGAYDVDLKTLEEVDGELSIYFEYKAMPKKTKQSALNDEALSVLLRKSTITMQWQELLSPRPTDKNAKRTLLEKHLTDYTGKNSADYFIHKDLGKFLSNELDFYIKNEVMNLDDVANATSFKQIENNLKLIQVLRKIAIDLIAFLAQLENFQRKLWLKKKFVVACNYCVTIDRVPEELYEEIADNQAQWDEWESLGFLSASDKEGDLFSPTSVKTGSIEYLKAFPYLLVDTKFFSDEFKYKLIQSIDEFDEKCDGLLIHSENYQALSFIENKYTEKVDCITIDPPYNTERDREVGNFIYKDGFPESSWMSLMGDRVSKGYSLLANTGLHYSFIGDDEHSMLELLLKNEFKQNNFLGNIIWKKKTNGNNMGFVPYIHDNILVFCKDVSYLSDFGWPEDNVKINKRYKNTDDDPRGPWNVSDLSANHEGPHFPITNPKTKEIHYPPKGRYWVFNEEEVKKRISDGRIIFGKSGVASPVQKKFLAERVSKRVRPESIWLSSGLNSDGTAELTSFFDPKQFDHPKPSQVIKDTISTIDKSNTVVLDYFAGSGTTGHAVINLNREDQGQRKFILVEMGEYFDKVTKPRIQKVVYSKDWKDKKAQTHKSGNSHCFKYLKLESYEDTLNNLKLSRNDQQEELFNSKGFPKDDYILNYMLEEESKGSLLSVNSFLKPFDYKMDIAVDSAGACEPTKVDLVETFNYLIGLKVEKYDADFKRGFVMVEGRSPQDEKVLVIWRDCEKVSYDELTTICQRKDINPRDLEYDIVYVNGDHHLPNINSSADMEGAEVSLASKVRSIEDEFLTKMFEVEDV